MREIKVNGVTLHIARNEKEWKKEIDKRYDYDTKFKEYHHIVEKGNAPILRWCVENGIKIDRGIHVKQKSISYEERVKFQKWIRMLTPKDVWDVLQKIKKYSKIDAKCTKLVGEQMDA